MAVSRVTLKDIAAKTGYSVNTVSRALRGDPRLSESTREKIRQTADEAGYIKNNFASTLRSGTSHLIAIVVNDICNSHYSYVISDMERCLRMEGYDILILCSSKDGGENLSGSHIIQIAVTQSVDGILYFPYQHDHASIDFMNRAGIPFVLVDRKIEGIAADVVCCDDYAGGRLAAEHFLSLGHRRFLYIQGPAYSSSQSLREQGFTETLTEHGIPSQDIHFFPDENLMKNDICEKLIHKIQSEQITAVLVFRDEMAYLFMNQLYRDGLRIPRDLSVIGFDNLYGPFPYLQPLSSIFCPEDCSLGAEAARLLLRRIKNPEADVQEIIFPVKLYQNGTE